MRWLLAWDLGQIVLKAVIYSWLVDWMWASYEGGKYIGYYGDVRNLEGVTHMCIAHVLLVWVVAR